MSWTHWFLFAPLLQQIKLLVITEWLLDLLKVTWLERRRFNARAFGPLTSTFFIIQIAFRLEILGSCFLLYLLQWVVIAHEVKIHKWVVLILSIKSFLLHRLKWETLASLSFLINLIPGKFCIKKIPNLQIMKVKIRRTYILLTFTNRPTFGKFSVTSKEDTEDIYKVQIFRINFFFF